jgi:hypothetical protein
MSESVTIEQRLRRFVSTADDADWQDVLNRADIRPSRRPRITPRRLVVALVLVLALVLAAVSIAGGSLFGFSNRGTRVQPPLSIRRLLDDQTLHRLGFTFRLHTVKLLAFRHGFGFYTARTKKGDHLCYLRVQGRGNFPYFECAPYAGFFVLPERIVGNPDGSKKEQIAWIRNHPFPSPARPLMDMSELSVERGTFDRLLGLAADGVRSVQLLALSDCHPIVTVPVIDNVYIQTGKARGTPAFLVARNASGKIIWHSAKTYMTAPQVRAPLERKLPRNCGLR